MTTFYGAIPASESFNGEDVYDGCVIDDVWLFKTQKAAIKKATEMSEEDGEGATVLEISIVGAVTISKTTAFKEAKSDAKKA